MSSRRTLAGPGFPVCSWGLFLSMPCKLVLDMDRLDFLETQGSGMIGAAPRHRWRNRQRNHHYTKLHPTAIPAGPRFIGEGRGGEGDKRPDDAGQAYHNDRVVMLKYHSAQEPAWRVLSRSVVLLSSLPTLKCASSRRGVDPSKWNAGPM
ncbi:hypothetical protein CGRA01v4_06847 [Colletotrichum graminicola]|nr:hypothetical protein CGRA01v4_06847 [Colletotrichum graminicola]